MTTVDVSCPKCKRRRKVGEKTLAAGAAVHAARGPTPEWARWPLRCLTCRYLESIQQHREAIRLLERKVMERRLRGL